MKDRIDEVDASSLQNSPSKQASPHDAKKEELKKQIAAIDVEMAQAKAAGNEGRVDSLKKQRLRLVERRKQIMNANTAGAIKSAGSIPSRKTASVSNMESFSSFISKNSLTEQAEKNERRQQLVEKYKAVKDKFEKIRGAMKPKKGSASEDFGKDC